MKVCFFVFILVFSLRVDIQYYISFTGTAQSLDIHRPYETIASINLVPT